MVFFFEKHNSRPDLTSRWHPQSQAHWQRACRSFTCTALGLKPRTNCGVYNFIPLGICHGFWHLIIWQAYASSGYVTVAIDARHHGDRGHAPHAYAEVSWSFHTFVRILQHSQLLWYFEWYRVDVITFFKLMSEGYRCMGTGISCCMGNGRGNAFHIWYSKFEEPALLWYSVSSSNVSILLWLSFGVFGVKLSQVWDIIKVMDYLTTRPDIDPAHIGMMGISLGGLLSRP